MRTATGPEAAANTAWPGPDAAPVAPDDRLERAFDELDVLASAPNGVVAAQTAAYVLERLIPCAYVAIGLYDIDADLLRFVAVRHDRRDVARAPLALSSSGVLAERARAGLAALWDATDAPFDVNDTPGLASARTMCIVPFSVRGRLRGVVQLVDRRGRGFDAEDAAIVEYVAERVGAVVAR